MKILDSIVARVSFILVLSATIFVVKFVFLNKGRQILKQKYLLC